MKRPALAVLTLAAAGMVLALVLERQAQARWRERNAALQEEVERLARIHATGDAGSPLVLQAHTTSSLPGESWRELLRLRGEVGRLRREQAEAGRLGVDNSRLHSNWVEQLAGGKKLGLAQLAPYLSAKQRTPESLLAASRLTGDLGLLREALEKHPTDPRVNFTAYFALKGEVKPEERQQWLEALKQSAPGNALANYLSAQADFKAGRTGEAVQELMAASGKPGFEVYSADLVESAAEAYQSVGLSSLEAAELASGQPLPHLAELQGLGQSLGELAKSYRQAGDDASARAAVQLGVTLGHQIAEPSAQNPVIAEFVGLALERQILEALEPSSPYDDAGLSVKDRLEALTRERESLKALLHQGESLLRNAAPPDLANYYDRMRTAGESEALRWLVSRPTGP
jgi:hypothetical protein